MPYLPTAAYSIYVKVELQNVPNTLGRFATAVGAAGDARGVACAARGGLARIYEYDGQTVNMY